MKTKEKKKKDREKDEIEECFFLLTVRKKKRKIIIIIIIIMKFFSRPSSKENSTIHIRIYTVQTDFENIFFLSLSLLPFLFLLFFFSLHL